MGIMKKSLLCIFLITLFGCSEQKLGDGYFYLPDYEAMDVGYPYGSIVYKSNQKNVYRDILIHADVISCTVKGHYILVVQKPNKALRKKEIMDIVSLRNNNYSERNKSIVADSLINSYEEFRNPINYYVIEKQSGVLGGPFTKSEFEKFKATL